MLYFILTSFVEDYNFLNIIRYLSFRSGLALITSLLIVFVFAPNIIGWLKSNQKDGQPIRVDGPEWHLEIKRGTPTMGGVIILGSLIISTLLWADLSNIYVWIVLYITLGFGLIGFIDDYLKILKNNHKGLSGRLKLIFQIFLTFVAALWIYLITDKSLQGMLAFPFLKDTTLYIGFTLWCVFSVLVVVGSSNAVNLTDGLDGLAIVPIIIAAGVFGVIAYLSGNIIFSDYLNILYIPNIGELVIFSFAFVGACIGFIWYNSYPAQVFMGDTGSLAIGGAIGMTAICAKQEFLLVIIGFVFVMEAVSVILQVGGFKLRRKRLFAMAPEASDQVAQGSAADLLGGDMEATKERMTPSGLKITDLVEGTGTEAQSGNTVSVNYRGTLTNGQEFDSSYRRNQAFTFPLGGGRVIRGWDEGVVGMKEGGKRCLVIPPDLAYGSRGAGGVIGPNETLIFEIELVKVQAN